MMWLWASAALATEWKAREPIDVTGRPLEALALAPVEGAEAERTALIEAARAAGWPIVSEAEAATFVLSGRVLDRYEVELGRRDGRAVDVRFQVADRQDGTVLYEVTTRGWTAEGGADPVAVAFDNLLARQALVALLTPLAPAEGADLLTITTCRTAPMALPDRLPALLPAVVDVEQAGVAGRGVLISPDGYVLTGAPVGPGTAEVTLHSGMRLQATVERTDPVGVALLKLPGTGFPCVAPAVAFQVGMPVFVVRGGAELVSGTLLGTPEIDGATLVQTDAAPGGGGPLLDASGGLVAATTANGLAVPTALSRARLQIAWGERSGAAAPAPAPRVPIAALDEDDPPLVALDARVCLFRPRPGDAVALEVASRRVSLEGERWTCVLVPSGKHTVARVGAVAPPAVTVAPGETLHFKVLGKLGVEPESEKAFEKARSRGLIEAPAR